MPPVYFSLCTNALVSALYNFFLNNEQFSISLRCAPLSTLFDFVIKLFLSVSICVESLVKFISSVSTGMVLALEETHINRCLERLTSTVCCAERQRNNRASPICTSLIRTVYIIESAIELSIRRLNKYLSTSDRVSIFSRTLVG